MQLTIYYKEDDKWLVEKLETKAYSDRKSLSQTILTTLDQYITSQEGDSARPTTPRVPQKRGPKPGSKRKKRGI
jgi:hypothetical protein